MERRQASCNLVQRASLGSAALQKALGIQPAPSGSGREKKVYCGYKPTAPPQSTSLKLLTFSKVALSLYSKVIPHQCLVIPFALY